MRVAAATPKDKGARPPSSVQTAINIHKKVKCPPVGVGIEGTKARDSGTSTRSTSLHLEMGLGAACTLFQG